jgi:TatD DNase family protein
MFFDTHVHFDALEGDQGLSATVGRALKANVDRMIAVGGSADMNKMAVEAAKRFPSNIRAAIGFDRDNAAKQTAGIEEVVAQLESEISGSNTKNRAIIAAIGEIGLDFHYSPETAAAQIILFRAQLALAGRLKLPVIVHSREADEASLAELRRHAENWTGEQARIGVLHCFTRDSKVAGQLLDLGFHISFSGIVTFTKASALREVAKVIPGDRILIETDSPYLAPVPHRGKRCEPMYVRHVAETLASVRGCSVEELARQTSENAGQLFGFQIPAPTVPEDTGEARISNIETRNKSE